MFRALLLGLGVFAALVTGQMNAPPSQADFERASIDEVMTSYGGDANVQFVEIKMEAIGQNVTTDTVLGAFDASGNYLSDLLVVPGDVASGENRPWLMGTTQFQTVSGLAPDFIMPAGLSTDGGMVCWGAPGFRVPDPPGSWDHTNTAKYTDCVAYGTYSGPGNLKIGTTTGSFPARDDADGHSLRRVQETSSDANDWVCPDTARPQNNDFMSASLIATTPCLGDPDIDTDGDGLSDGDEINIHGTSPYDTDTDGDGLTDGDEVTVHGTNPSRRDTDGDGTYDGTELFIGTDPLEACPNNSSHDASPFDTNRSKVINLADLVGSPGFKTSFGSSDGEPNYYTRFDWNASGNINLLDLVTEPGKFKFAFGTSCGNGAVRIDETGDGPFELTSAEEFYYPSSNGAFDEWYTLSSTWRVRVTAADASNISFKVTCPGLDEHDFDIAHSGGTNTITCNDGSKVEITVD